MKKTTRELLIVLGLLGVLLALLLPRLRQTSGREPSAQVIASTPQAVATPPAAEVAQPLPIPPAAVRPSYTAEAAARRDPMVSLLPDQTQASESPATGRTPSDNTAWRAPPVGGALSVEGMVWGPARTQALINGTLYEVGDAVEGARIVSIEREGVTVERDGVQVLVTTPPPASVSRADQRAVGQGTRWYGQPQGR